MQKTEEDTISMDLFNYIKIKTNNMAVKYLENNMTKHNITVCPIFWAPQ